MHLKYRAIAGIEPSPAEMIVADKLRYLKVNFIQEVEFSGFINPSTGFHYRFDFYLPQKNVLIEYDGKEFHRGNKEKRRDRLKDEFAKANKIKLIRLNSFYTIHASLVAEFGVIRYVQSHDVKMDIKRALEYCKKEHKQPRVPLIAAEASAIREYKHLEQVKKESQSDFILRMKYLRNHKPRVFLGVVDIYRKLKKSA